MELSGNCPYFGRRIYQHTTLSRLSALGTEEVLRLGLVEESQWAAAVQRHCGRAWLRLREKLRQTPVAALKYL